MIDVTTENFEAEVIAASMTTPVLVDFWAPWCGPCKALGPVLEQLEVDYAGRFALAKLNSDEQPEISAQLSEMFGVRSIPLCVLFKDGQPVDGFIGALPEAQVRAFLDKQVPSAAETAATQEVAAAESPYAGGDIDAAIEKLREAVAINPADDGARCDYLRVLLGAGRIIEARSAYEPVASNVVQDARVAAYGHWLAACEQAAGRRSHQQLDLALTADKRDFDARFERSQKRFTAQDFTGAMDELLEILMRDNGWREGLARKTYVAILEIMTRPEPAPESPQAACQGALEVASQSPITAGDPVLNGYLRRLSMVVFYGSKREKWHGT